MNNIKEGVVITIIIIAVSLFIVTIALTAIILNNTIVVEGPCVDGYGDANLEGIMCEKEVYRDTYDRKLPFVSLMLSTGMFILAAKMSGYD